MPRWLHQAKWQYLLLAGFCLLVSVPLLLTTMAPYDDEGFVMMTLKSFMENHPLYEETYTQYGPSYYLLTAPLHSVLGLPLSHHMVRLKTALFWLLPVLLTMGIMLRIGGNRWLALATSCMVTIHLSRLALEPGHPQEIALLMCMLGLWLLCDHSPRRWWMAGCCAAICGMCKLNVGFIMTTSLLLAACVEIPRFKYARRSMLFAVWALGSLAISATMLKSNLGSLGILHPIAILLSWSAVAFLASKTRVTSSCLPKLAGFNPLLATVAAGTIVTCLIALWARLNGTSWSMLVWGMVGQHHAHTKYFFHPIPLSIFTMVSACGVLACYRNQRWLGVASAVCIAIAIAKTAGGAVLPLNNNCQDCAEWLSIIGPCFAPGLVLFRRRTMRGRVMLAGMTVLGPWIAYPLAGTQLMLGSLPGWMTMGIVFSDAVFAWGVARRVSPSTHSPMLDMNAFARFMLMGSLATGLASSFVSTKSWVAGTSLGLPGSDWIHLASHEAAVEQQIVQDIVATGASHLVFDGHTFNRFYFWTGLKPLTNANATLWPFMLSPAQLAELRQSIAQSRSLCVVVRADIPAPHLEEKGDVADTRKILYEDTRFVPSAPTGWSIGFRSKSE
jgi:hypothetical protein